MDMSGSETINASIDAVWAALNDPAVLQGKCEIHTEKNQC